MSDTRDPNDPYGPFDVTPPEAFEPPRREPEQGTTSAPEPLFPGEPVPYVTGELVPMPAAEPVSMVAAEPVPLMAGGPSAPAAETRMAIDGGSIRMGRVVEEMVAWLKTLASAAVYATLIVTFGFQVARVEGQSMAPTLADQDRLIVNKLAYRLDKPQVGDIVMLYYPLKPEKSFVKRVIAEEGDQVRIVDGKVYRNDVLMDDSFVPAEYRSHDDFGPQVIPEGYYFVMGDHRNNSSDSRHWGNVPEKYIIGKVQLRWWPLPNGRIF
jgi:signal peptidase I